MNQQERDFRESLTENEMNMLNSGKGFKITDVVWGRAGSDWMKVWDNPTLLQEYKEKLQSYLLILNSNKDYGRANLMASKIQFLDSCGINENALADGEILYYLPNDLTVVNTGFQYIAKSINQNRITEKFAESILPKTYRSMFNKRVIPFSYISSDDFVNMFFNFKERFDNNKEIVLYLNEYFPKRDWSNDIETLYRNNMVPNAKELVSRELDHEKTIQAKDENTNNSREKSFSFIRTLLNKLLP